MPAKVLIVDDSRQSRTAIKEAVRDIFTDFIEAGDGITALKAFIGEAPSLVITDVEMPGVNGYRLVSTIRGMNTGGDVPIIMFSATRRALKDRLAGFKLGTSDFLMKPFDDAELAARAGCRLKTHNLIMELRERNALFEKLTVTDALTGLYNRRYFLDAANEQMALGLRHGFKIAFMLIGIDHFKTVNDTWGRQAGDDVLKKLGSLLNSRRRKGELLARHGAEEFIICLFNTAPEKAMLAAQRFRRLISSHAFSSIHHPRMHITASIGAAVYPQDGVAVVDELVTAAGSALFRAKKEGRDRAMLYSPSIDGCISRQTPHSVRILKIS
ncbi:MAG: diguanylate cyclase [Deltaproteobacteria bacterium]